MAWSKFPHPDPAYLARLLRTPQVRAILPAELNDIPAPSLSRAAAALRQTAFAWFMLGVAVLALAAWRGANNFSVRIGGALCRIVWTVGRCC